MNFQKNLNLKVKVSIAKMSGAIFLLPKQLNHPPPPGKVNTVKVVQSAIARDRIYEGCP
jgi:hypothetical protein